MIKIEDFSLAWRWISASHGDFSKDTLNKLIPLSEEQARALIAATPINFPVGAKRFDSTEGSELTRQWLKGLVNDSQTITICWDQETALTLPWLIFCDHWDDFCYPSSDDINFYLESGELFLRWNHYEVFEFDSSAM
ncbi:hypothetical protein I6F50_13040 [Pseudoalteromonas sp. NZS127_1]|uniref:hypothetical protein n=1 Tax=unclassified Pseudoalteromonas TaxID=194690 RepID=UPI0013FDEA69|nr:MULTISPECIES: hypothetical protein [unclassified Pseudoalteromonas]MBG9995992.1 hypothetical protein [Pseudoalteromonas sp. NZS127_1]MBH0012636.1 hypothetical protein [Pseudoalteromonas sp. NZS100_1]MBH0044014.1 hypothetical protein [Pseudoalteromonas sp. SWXJZ10B]MBH0051870.1 hypothetical protein [Pseudoalteromonas sp. SWYJZ19]